MGVRVERTGEEVFRLCDLNQFTEVHHGDSIADVLDDKEMMGDKEVREVELLPQFMEEIQYLRLHRDIQRRGGLIEDDELRVRGNGPGNGYALSLTAGKFVRIA